MRKEPGLQSLPKPSLGRQTSRRGQASAEYLVLMAMALVLMLILVALLGGFDGAIGGVSENEASIYWEGTARPFSITAWGQSGDTLYLNVVNMGNEHLFLRKIYVNNVVADLEPGWSWRSTSAKTISIPDLPACDVNGYENYAYNISFVYDSTILSDLRQDGEKPVVGTCG